MDNYSNFKGGNQPQTIKNGFEGGFDNFYNPFNQGQYYQGYQGYYQNNNMDRVPQNNVTQDSGFGYQQNEGYHDYQGNYYNGGNEDYSLDNMNYEFKSKFPFLRVYSTEDEIRKVFAPCSEFNLADKDLASIEPGFVYLMKANTPHNIHKAIKYGIWTSTPRNNEMLSNAFHDAKSHGLPVYLIFTTLKSGGLIGLAEMTSAFNPGMSFKYWEDENRWFGSFKLKWHFLKDIPFTDGNMINNLKDCSEISIKNAVEIISIFSKVKSVSWIFDKFIQLDREEDFLRSKRDNDPEFAKTFAELSKKHSENPFSLKKGLKDSSSTFVSLAIREYEAKEDDPLEKAMEERFVIKSANDAKNQNKKKFKKKKRNVNEEEGFKREEQI